MAILQHPGSMTSPVAPFSRTASLQAPDPGTLGLDPDLAGAPRAYNPITVSSRFVRMTGPEGPRGSSQKPWP